ncbi:DNA-binding protein [Halobacillus shinanisalinarum]|uniref:DNA-binding protein n=1 Tax=Halobacillus shinanisalinarum TaxID=2932258 RepID=A0ABY4H3S2_9BACI|nr:DNA-binding protein [Halobacillus shinanisalinarum]UOQ94851.1 DNA-binding protein [Halobacillus shinanisalinarum]
MSKAVYDLTAKQINLGFQEKDHHLIEKETDFILNKIVTVMLTVFSDKIEGITFDHYGVILKSEYLLSEKHQENLLKWLKRLMEIEYPSSDIEFGKLKVDLENWYYKMGGEEIHFHYHDDYLLTPKEASERLGVSRVTLNKYIQQGLESLDTSSHHKIPLYVIDLWNDPVYCIRMQMIAQQRKMGKQTPLERLQEINNELSKLQIKYKKPNFKEAFGHLNGDNLDDPADYYLWRDLEDDKEEILKHIGGS